MPATQLKQTMIQYTAPAPEDTSPASKHDPHKTMLGYSMPKDAIPAAFQASDTIRDDHRPDLQKVAAQASQDALRHNVPMQTILGVAMPGIAPTGGGPKAPARHDQMGQTQLGAPPIPIPMSAPRPAHLYPQPSPVHHAHAEPTAVSPPSSRRIHAPQPRAEPVRIVPRPPPLVEEPLPAPPRLRKKRGVPIALVAAAIAVCTIIAGALLLTFWHGTPALTGEPRTGADGAELLHVSCPSCEAGSSISLEGSAAHPSGGAGAARVALTKGEADLPLQTALHIGTNTFSLALNRPGVSREETVTLDVPVTYRITPDLSRLSSRPPQLALRVEAVVGSEVTVNGAKVTLDAGGHGSAPVDIAADVEGTSDEMTLVQRKLPYAIKLPGGTTETGSLALRVGVAQLHLEAPGRTPVTSAAQVTVAGVVAKTAEVYLGETQLAVGTDGRFAQTVPVVMGMTPLILSIEQGATVATRTMHLSVQRVPDLQAEATTRDAANLPGYDAIAGEIDTHAGQSIAIEGPIMESRQVGRGTILLVDDHRGCSRSPCLVRVLHGEIDDPGQGTVVRVYGKVTRSFRTNGGAVVPEVEADFLVPGAASSAHAGARRTFNVAPDARY